MPLSPPFWWRPLLAIYLLVFVWPTIQMFGISFTDAPLIGDGDWVGTDNYARLPTIPASAPPPGTPPTS
jgi:ABC-type sugar transport system permease subunit